MKHINRISFAVLLLVIAPAYLVAVLRGNVGTDTIFYIGNYEQRALGSLGAREYEPGFNFLSELFIYFDFSARFFLISIATIITVLLCYGFKGAKEKVMVFFLVLFPLYYVDFTMNGIRYGLSFAIATIAIGQYYKKQNILFFLLAAIAISIQYSALLLLLVFVLEKLSIRKLIIMGSVLTVIIVALLPYLSAIVLYLTLKQEAYQDLTSPGITSGLAPLIIFLLIFGFFVKKSLNGSDLKGLYIILFFEIISFIVSKFTYAGLRFQTLFLYALLIYIVYNYEKLSQKHSNFKVLLIVSLLSFTITLKNISSHVEDDNAPFLPYKFIWDEN